ncbi:MAG: AAA family ATPase, partial [Myxococcales bacterium]|nr:AAA family ATPase [Myxococcales bacterium]
MLTQLSIEDLAIVDRLELEFGPGLTVLTGETGAGKSIVVDALVLALGGRGSPEYVRAGAERAAVGASFDLTGRPDLVARLGAMGIETDGPLAVRRTITRDGRSRVWMGGTPATVAMLAEIGAELVDFHGQHEHQSLRERRVHRELLDAFAKAETDRDAVVALYAEVTGLEAELATLRVAERGRAERLDFLAFQIRELEEADLQPGESESLEIDQSRLANVERLREAVGGAVELLAGEERAAADLVREAAQLIGGAADSDATLGDAHRRLLGALAELDDLADGLRRYTEDLEADPERLAEVEARIGVLHRLGRKHGATVEEMLGRLGALRAEHEALEGGEARADEIERKLGRLREDLAQA